MRLVEGQVFGRLAVLDGKGRKVLCRCSCGTERRVDRYSLMDGRTVSCGCYSREIAAGRCRAAVKHPVRDGDRFGRWLALDASDRSAVKVRCECGTERAVSASHLVSGASRSCGCLKRQVLSERPNGLTHGLGRHPLYDTWYHMVSRCTDPSDKSWRNYGARDIRIYGPWFDVSRFIEDIMRTLGPRPDGMSIDRTDNDGNYEPGNIRWATRSEQNRNQRRNRATAGVTGLP